jgi:hypothetical protein
MVFFFFFSLFLFVSSFFVSSFPFLSFRHSVLSKHYQKQLFVVVTFSLSRVKSSSKIVTTTTTTTTKEEEEEEEMIFNLEGLTVYFPYEYLYPVRVSTRAQTRTRAFFISLRSLARTLPFVCLLALTRNFPSRHGTNNFFYAGTIPIHD